MKELVDLKGRRARCGPWWLAMLLGVGLAQSGLTEVSRDAEPEAVPPIVVTVGESSAAGVASAFLEWLLPKFQEMPRNETAGELARSRAEQVRVIEEFGRAYRQAADHDPQAADRLEHFICFYSQMLMTGGEDQQPILDEWLGEDGAHVLSAAAKIEEDLREFARLAGVPFPEWV